MTSQTTVINAFLNNSLSFVAGSDAQRGAETLRTVHSERSVLQISLVNLQKAPLNPATSSCATYTSVRSSRAASTSLFTTSTLPQTKLTRRSTRCKPARPYRKAIERRTEQTLLAQRIVRLKWLCSLYCRIEQMFLEGLIAPGQLWGLQITLSLSVVLIIQITLYLRQKSASGPKTPYLEPHLWNVPEQVIWVIHAIPRVPVQHSAALH